jgi:hypothetical protein
MQRSSAKALQRVRYGFRLIMIVGALMSIAGLRRGDLRLARFLHLAWRIGVALGLAGGIIQVAFALIRPLQPPVLRTA